MLCPLGIVMDVWCAIRTYPKHAVELGNPIPQEPVFFLKSRSTIVPFGEIDTCGGDVHHEIELVLKIGENLEITDMAIGLDLTKRSVQDSLKEQKLPWAQAKSFRGAAVLGDWVPFDARAEYSLAVNGNETQFGSLKEMSWTPNELLEKLAEWAPLQSGDILFTGTPAGVGPLTPNDVVTASLYIDKQLVLSHRAECV